MAEVTEIVFLALKETVDVKGQRFLNLPETIIKHGKPHRMYVGAQVEQPNVHYFFIDWSSVDHHMEFTKYEGYKAFVDDAVDQCEKPLHLFHVGFEPFPPTAAFGGVTEYIQAYFPANYSPEDQKTFHEGMKRFGSAVERDWDECKGAAGGWAVEELDDPKSGDKAKVYVELISWPSVESHMKYRETQSFKDNIHLLRGGKDLKNVVMVHVAAKEFKA